MRQLTQTEIDNAPDWATHYSALKWGVLYQSNEYFQADGDGSKCSQSRVSDEAKPIPRKEFDIDISFNKQEITKLTSRLENVNDCGPPNEGWQSDELIDLISKLNKAAENLK